MTIALALLQLITAVDAFPERTIEPPAAVEAFTATCWRGLRNPALFHAAVTASPLHFQPAATEHGGERYRAETADVHYNPADRICSMTFRVADAAAANRFVEGLTERLGLGAPEQGWILDRGSRQYRWADVPIDELNYLLEAEADIAADGRRPVDVQLFLGFSRRL